jgi:hypothetical protein
MALSIHPVIHSQASRVGLAQVWACPGLAQAMFGARIHVQLAMNPKFLLRRASFHLASLSAGYAARVPYGRARGAAAHHLFRGAPDDCEIQAGVLRRVGLHRGIRSSSSP